jgi:anaerobic magnesium-protoporphyrin IX monomethyl ester cyclase
MKVLLITPPRLQRLREIKSYMPPISLLYLASALREHNHTPAIHDLSIIDGLTTGNRDGVPAALAQSISQFCPDLFAINCYTSLHFPSVAHLAQSLRVKYSDTPIAIGGAHPSLFPREILSNIPYIDYVVGGEGEEQLVEIANALSREGRRADLSHIQSLTWRKNGEVIHQCRKNFVDDIDKLPDPAWDLIALSDYYTDHSEWNNPRLLTFNLAVPILSTRSCPFTCNFCAAFTTMGRKFRMRSPRRVVDEIQMLHESHGQSYFSFLDDNMNLNKSHILGICSEICKRGLNIEFETLSGLHIGSLDNEVIDALDRAGLVFVRLPIEHGNDRIRNDVIGKNLSREKIYEVCLAFKNKPHIRTSCMFIMGFPEETCETLEDTRKMILDLQLDVNQVSNLLPFPGTKVFDIASREGLLLHNYNADRLWAGETCLDPTESDFFLKPFTMTLEELKAYRAIFNTIRILPSSRILQTSGMKKNKESYDTII